MNRIDIDLSGESYSDIFKIPVERREQLVAKISEVCHDIVCILHRTGLSVSKGMDIIINNICATDNERMYAILIFDKAIDVYQKNNILITTLQNFGVIESTRDHVLKERDQNGEYKDIESLISQALKHKD